MSFNRYCPPSVFFFQVLINKNPCELQLYSRDRAEGMEFITLFDWVTPWLSSRSKQLLDFHSQCDLLPLPFLRSLRNSTSDTFPWPCFLLPHHPARSFSLTLQGFFLLFFPFSNSVTILAFPSSFHNAFLLDTCCSINFWVFFRSSKCCFWPRTDQCTTSLWTSLLLIMLSFVRPHCIDKLIECVSS